MCFPQHAGAEATAEGLLPGLQIKQTLLSWTRAANQDSRSQLQPFLRNKLAQVVVLIVRVSLLPVCTCRHGILCARGAHAHFPAPARDLLLGKQTAACSNPHAGRDTSVCMLQEQYPAGWPSVFRELIQMAQDDQGAVDMLCRILTSIDEDIITLEVPRCPTAGSNRHALTAP